MPDDGVLRLGSPWVQRGGSCFRENVSGAGEAGLGLWQRSQRSGVRVGFHMDTVEVLGNPNASTIQEELGQEEAICT